MFCLENNYKIISHPIFLFPHMLSIKVSFSVIYIIVNILYILGTKMNYSSALSIIQKQLGVRFTQL